MSGPFILAIAISIVCLTLYLLYDRTKTLGENFGPPKWVHEAFESGAKKVPTVEFPFKNIRDQSHNLLDIIAISAPFREKAHDDLYEQYREKGLRFLGISSYLNFPDKILNPYEDRYHEKAGHDYLKMVDAWVHCFREPSEKLRASGLPLLLSSEADLKDVDMYRPDPAIEKTHDFIYVCLDDNDRCDPGWQSHNRNWDLAKESLKIMCANYGLTGIIVGRNNCRFTKLCKGSITMMPFMEFGEFQRTIQRCRFLFVPNVADASPRIITEALCYNMPVLVNEHIFGGWHNVVAGVTGEFFSGTQDLPRALDRITKLTTYRPREWFVEHRGKKSRKEFAEFLNKIYDTHVYEAFI
jgi:hypothetical protein